jgi:hypothetical protein
MRKIYNNHVFQRSTKPWQWLAIISFSVALFASLGAYLTARSWVVEGRYLQAIDINQIEVLRLIPALEDLQRQTSGTHILDADFFNNLKKADRLLRSMTDDVKLPSDSPNEASPLNSTSSQKPIPVTASPANSKTNSAALKSSANEVDAIEPLSDNPVLAFFQKLDSKIMKLVFGKPDKYAQSEKEEDLAVTPGLPEQKSANALNAVDVQGVLVGAKTAEQSIVMVLAQEKGLAGLDILAKSAEVMLSAKGPLELDKMSSDSPVKKYAESLSDFVKANAVWQKNITSASASIELQKALGAVIDQKVLIEIEAGKKSSGKSTLGLTQAMPKVHQTPWHTKLPQETASSLKLYANNIQTVREFASDHEALRIVALKNSKGLQLFDFSTAGGFLGLIMLSIIGLVGAGLGGAMYFKNAQVGQAQAQGQKTATLANAADELLGSIDLGLAKSAPIKTQPVRAKSEPQLSAVLKLELVIDVTVIRAPAVDAVKVTA